MRRYGSRYLTQIAGGASAADGSLNYPYQATGADVSAVQTALGALGASNGDFAIAYITGGQEYLLEYNSTSSAWYAVGGGDGSELAPYWSASTGDTGIDALPTPKAAQYAVTGATTATPLTWRGRVATVTGGAQQIPLWVAPTVYAYGAPAVCTAAWYVGTDAGASVVAGEPNAAFSIVASGGTGAGSSVSGGRAVITSGTDAGSTRVVGGGADTSGCVRTWMRVKKFAASAVAATENNQYVYSTMGAGGELTGLFSGGTVAPNATEWWVYGPAGAPTATGISATTQTTIELDKLDSTNALTVTAGMTQTPTLSVTSDLAVGGGISTRLSAARQTTQKSISFEYFVSLGWT